jgi:hypothetical protein
MRLLTKKMKEHQLEGQGYSSLRVAGFLMGEDKQLK